MEKSNVVLCGFMGSGKTTVGRMLAARLACCFVDMDKAIEEGAGMSIPDIFSVFGEAHFRMLEEQTAAALAGQEKQVIATGGGALLNGANAARFRQNGVIVYLDVPFALCWQRIAASDRPLVRRLGRQGLAALYQEREAAYRQAADITVAGTDAHALLKAIEAALLAYDIGIGKSI